MASGLLVANLNGFGFPGQVDPAHNMAAADTHWAFVPLQKPELPPTAMETGNAVDAFILAKLQERGLRHNGPADNRSLIRRVTYGLTGLPPTYEEVQAFLADESASAYERLVERLLASIAYGERWGRHWLDVARYADTEGRPNFRENRYAYSHTYRDYVIESFNDDKPFDRFIMEQIAADRLELGRDKSELAALGFLTLGKSFFRRKDFIIDDQIDVITRGLQGLTVTCARCHDHKFDPIPTKDYYSLHGIFASSEVPEDLPVIRRPKNEADHAAYLAEIARIENEIDEKSNELIDSWLKIERSRVGNFLGAVETGKTITDDYEFTVFAGSNQISEHILQLWIEYLETDEGRAHPVLMDWFEKYAENDPEAGIAYYNELFSQALDEELEGFAEVQSFLNEPGTPLNPTREELALWLERKIRQDNRDLLRELEALEWTHPGTPYRAHVLADVAEPKNSAVYVRGNPKNPGEKVPRQYLEVLAGEERKPFSIGSGRLELARTITSEQNPLTARVFVNRVWGWHMGKEIVDTPSDFGVRTPEPVQVDLLNWLAGTFIESGWSVKELHRLIVLSKTYRQASKPNAEAVAADPENLLWHHFPRSRLDFESMRDTLLAVSGNLDRTMGGVQQDILDATSNRRTVYSYFDRTEPPGIFRTFDHPSPDATSPKRFETVVPQQALFLMNNPFAIHQAKYLADRIDREAGDDARSRIRQYYRVVFQRDPTMEEIDAALEFITNSETVGATLAAKGASNSEGKESLSGWELYAQVLLMSNELMFVD